MRRWQRAQYQRFSSLIHLNLCERFLSIKCQIFLGKIPCINIFLSVHWFLLLFFNPLTYIYICRSHVSNLCSVWIWRWISFWQWEIFVPWADDSWKTAPVVFPFKGGPSPSKQRSPHKNLCHFSVSVHVLLLRGCERSSTAGMSLCGQAFAQCFKAYMSSSVLLKGSEVFQSLQVLQRLFYM